VTGFSIVTTSSAFVGPANDILPAPRQYEARLDVQNANLDTLSNAQINGLFANSGSLQSGDNPAGTLQVS